MVTLLNGATIAQETSAGIKDMTTEPTFSGTDDEGLFDFSGYLEHEEGATRSTSEGHGNAGGEEMCDLSPIAPEPSPLTSIGMNDANMAEAGDAENGIDTGHEEAQMPMVVGKHRADGNEVLPQTSNGDETAIGESDSRATAATNPQVDTITSVAAQSAAESSMPLSPPDSDQDFDQQPPLLATEILKAVAVQKQFKKGDVAIVLDANDLSTALLVPSSTLMLASKKFSAADLGGVLNPKATAGISHIFVLEPTDPIPILRALGVDSTPQDLPAQTVTEAKIKKEDGNEAETAGERAGSPDDIDDKWTTAYKSLFEVMDASMLGVGKRQVFDKNAVKAHAHILAVMAIAKHYEALEAPEMAFVRSMNDWIRNSTLYDAIRDDPVSWLDIGITMRNRDIFDEAFIHCAGALVGIPDGVADVHPDVVATMKEKAAEIRERGKRVDPKLSNLTLTTEVRDRRPGYNTVAFVSIKHDPVSWIVNQLFTDWMREHLHFLHGDEDMDESVGEDDPAAGISVKTTATCDHKGNKCLSIGGFYRLLGKADDSYLPLEKVLELLAAWDKKFAYDSNKANVAEALRKLKTRAKEIVGLLAESRLTFAGAEELEYLTCVEVGDWDVPWEIDDGDVKMEG